jgi:pimeloyl-ACP methyl ester carboxylesterase
MMSTSERMVPAVIFLPGILMPAALRYERLLAALGEDVDPVVKELEVYRGPSTPPPGYSLEVELAGIGRVADEAGLERFHLYGHSGGGACALAFTASQPDRVLTLAVDEPAIDFGPEDLQDIKDVFLPMLELPPEQQMAAFVREQMRAGVDPPPRPGGPPPSWMSTRADGVAAMLRAFADSAVPMERLREFERPVYYTYGNLSNETWERRGERLSRLLPNITVEMYEGRSHMDTSHMAEPERVADALRRLWGIDSQR